MPASSFAKGFSTMDDFSEGIAKDLTKLFDQGVMINVP